LMTSSISAILGLIYAIVILIGFGIIAAFVPSGGLAIASIGIALIIIFPISMFLLYTTISFISALIYNMLVPKIGGIKLGLEGDEIKSLPVVPFALILSSVGAIWTFILGLLMAAVVVPLTASVNALIPILNAIVANATNVTNATNLTAANLPTTTGVGFAGVYLAILLIIGMPILVFIVTFIAHALTAIFYNFIIPRVGGIKLELVPEGVVHTIKSIPVVAASLAIASVALVWGIINGIIRLITMVTMGNAVGGVAALVMSIIGYFVAAFIMIAIITILYNYLSSKIGGVQLGLE